MDVAMAYTVVQWHPMPRCRKQEPMTVAKRATKARTRRRGPLTILNDPHGLSTFQVEGSFPRLVGTLLSLDFFLRSRL